MQVTYDANVCIHAGNCVKSLPTVFKVVDGQFVIDQQGASEAAIRQTVDKGELTVEGFDHVVLLRTPADVTSLRIQRGPDRTRRVAPGAARRREP